MRFVFGCLDPRSHWDDERPPNLHPETEPAAIAAEQRRVVLEAYQRGLVEPKDISVDVILPLWTVTRRLEELGLRESSVVAPTKPRRRGPKPKFVAAAIQTLSNGPMLALEIARAMGNTSTSSINRELARHPDLFHSVRSAESNGRPLIWSLLPQPQKESA